MLERHYAAIIIQSQYRQFRDYHSYQELLSEVIPTITVIQRHWRGFVQRRAYTSVIDATIQVQAFVRGAVLVRKSLLGSWCDASTCIQRIWRGFWTQLHYQMDLMDIVAVQCLVRKQQAIHFAGRKATAAQVLQCFARGHLARMLRAQLRQERNAAILIQVRILLPVVFFNNIACHLTHGFVIFRIRFVDFLQYKRLRSCDSKLLWPMLL